MVSVLHSKERARSCDLMARLAAFARSHAADPKTIGYIDKSDADASVKIVLALPWVFATAILHAALMPG